MAEELAFDQRRRQGRAVHAHEGARLPPAAFVHGPGEKLLAGPGRARGAARSNWSARPVPGARARAGAPRSAHDVVEVVIALDLLLQIDVVGFEPGVQPFDLGDAGRNAASWWCRCSAAPRISATSGSRSTSAWPHRRETPALASTRAQTVRPVTYTAHEQKMRRPLAGVGPTRPAPSGEGRWDAK